MLVRPGPQEGPGDAGSGRAGAEGPGASRAGQRSRLRCRPGHRRRRGPAPQEAPVPRRHLLAGLLACGMCGRRMESAWSNGKAAYRAATAVPAPWRRTLPGRRTPTCARTSCSAPARPAPPAHHPRGARPAPNPRRRRCNRHRKPGRGDRLPARARDHPHLEPGRRNRAGTRHTDCQDRHRESKLTRLQSPDQEGREGSERRSPGAGGSLRAGDDPGMPGNGQIWGITVSEVRVHERANVSWLRSPPWLSCRWRCRLLLLGRPGEGRCSNPKPSREDEMAGRYPPPIRT